MKDVEACSTCARAMNAEPNALCSSVPHWQAWHEVQIVVAEKRALDGAMRSCNVIIFGADALNVEDAYRVGYKAGAVACRERIRARKGEGT
jgi:hypothetical protein